MPCWKQAFGWVNKIYKGFEMLKNFVFLISLSCAVLNCPDLCHADAKQFEKTSVDDRIKSMLLKHDKLQDLQGQDFQMTISYGKMPFKVADPKQLDQFDLTLDGVNFESNHKQVTGYVLWHVPNNKDYKQSFKGQINLTTQVPVLKHAVLPGQVISSEDLVLKEVDLSKVSHKYALNPDDLIGTTPRMKALKPDQIIQLHDIKKPVLIQKGEMAQIIYKGSNIQIRAQAIAKNSGIKGQTLMFVNPSSNRILTAVVMDKNKAQINHNDF